MISFSLYRILRLHLGRGGKLPPYEATFLYNKLFIIQPEQGEWKLDLIKSPKEVVVMDLLRIGNTRTTRMCLLSKEDQPVCKACETAYIIKYIKPSVQILFFQDKNAII